MTTRQKSDADKDANNAPLWLIGSWRKEKRVADTAAAQRTVGSVSVVLLRGLFLSQCLSPTRFPSLPVPCVILLMRSEKANHHSRSGCLLLVNEEVPKSLQLMLWRQIYFGWPGELIISYGFTPQVKVVSCKKHLENSDLLSGNWRGRQTFCLFRLQPKKVVNASNIKRSHRFDYENAHPSENVIVAAVDYMAHGMECISPSILQTGTGSIAPAIKAFCDRVHIPAKKKRGREREIAITT